MRRALFLVVAGLIPLAVGYADDAAPPLTGFSGDRYAPLWNKSPFAIATAEATATSDYLLVGLAQFDGVSYVSLVDKQNQEHFVLTSARPSHDLMLISISHDARGITAVVDRKGERLVLQQAVGLAQAALPAPSPSEPPPVTALSNPARDNPFLPMQLRARFHRPVIVVPPGPADTD